MIKGEDGEILTDENKVIERWKTYFEDLLNRPEPDNPAEQATFYGPELEIEAPTRMDVKNAIKRLRNNKSPGIDNIPAEIWKYGGDILTDKMHDLITIIWREEITPDRWEGGILVPLHKKGDKLVCSNYRGINLLVTAYKVLTIIIYEKMKPFAESIIGEYQAGFRRGRSTTDQLFTIRQIIEKLWEYDKYQLHLFVDFKQAYDSIHRSSMWNIMKEMGIPDKLIRVTQACYRNTTCTVRFGKKMSTPIEIQTGLKQGCILSPLLFNIMMEKVARSITNRPEGIKFREVSINCLGYADDVDIITSDVRDTERITNIFRVNAESIGLKINQEKTKIMEIARRYEMNGRVNIDGI